MLSYITGNTISPAINAGRESKLPRNATNAINMKETTGVALITVTKGFKKSRTSVNLKAAAESRIAAAVAAIRPNTTRSMEYRILNQNSPDAERISNLCKTSCGAGRITEFLTIADAMSHAENQITAITAYFDSFFSVVILLYVIEPIIGERTADRCGCH